MALVVQLKCGVFHVFMQAPLQTMRYISPLCLSLNCTDSFKALRKHFCYILETVYYNSYTCIFKFV
jgi:hypothetical protein